VLVGVTVLILGGQQGTPQRGEHVGDRDGVLVAVPGRGGRQGRGWAGRGDPGLPNVARAAWNSANGFVFYGKDAELTGDREDQETSMLALHLLQAALVHLNTIFLQRILEDPAWARRLTDADRRALTPLFWSHVNPYGTFQLDMDRRLDLGRAPAADPA